MNDTKKRKTFTLAGDADRIDRILALFEAEELSQLLGAEVLDAGRIFEPMLVPTNETSKIDRLAHRWQELLDGLLAREYQPAYRNGHILTKTVNLGDRHVELQLQLEQSETDDIQLFVQVRPPHGQGYLPQGLEVSLMDESEQVILSKTAANQSNILDLTQSNRILCEWTDRLIVSFKLGKESIKEYFPT
jgi:hypothetical protein